MCVAPLLLSPVKAHILLPHQFSIKTSSLHQLIMAALLLHHPVVEDDYTICLLHHTHLVGYQQHGAVVALVQQSLVDLLGINMTQCYMWKTSEKNMRDLEEFPT